jgi:hypothetical protein
MKSLLIYLASAIAFAVLFGLGIGFVIGDLIGFYGCKLLFAILHTRKRWEFIYSDWLNGRCIGFGLMGDRFNNDGFLYVEWGMQQIYWRVPETARTYGIQGGAGFCPARLWLLVEDGHKTVGGRYRASLHIDAWRLRRWSSATITQIL